MAMSLHAITARRVRGVLTGRRHIPITEANAWMTRGTLPGGTPLPRTDPSGSFDAAILVLGAYPAATSVVRMVAGRIPLMLPLAVEDGRSRRRRRPARRLETQYLAPLGVPFFNLFARHIEIEADRFGLELTHENQATAMMFAKDAQSDLPPEWDAFFLTFRATHPSAGERICFANTYKPWEQGVPLAYGDVCKPVAHL